MDRRRGESLEGFIAEYCIVCRDVTEQALLRALRERRVENVASCCGCGVRLTTDAGAYRSIVDKPGEGILELMRRTHPRLPAIALARARHDHAVIHEQVPPEIREQAIREPFRVTTYLFAQETAFRPVMSGLLAGMFTGAACAVGARFAGLLGTGGYISRGAQFAGGVVFVLPMLIGLGVGWWRSRAELARRTSQMVSMAARALRPIRPTTEELERAVTMQRMGGHLPPSVTPARLAKEISLLSDTSFSNITSAEMAGMADAMRERAESFGGSSRTLHEHEGQDEGQA